MKTTEIGQNPAEKIEQYLQENGLTPQSANEIKSHFEPLHLKKGELFCQSGKLTNRLGVLFNGLLCAKYETAISAKETISRFYYQPKNIVVVSFDSFKNKTPANETIEAIEESFLFCLSKESLHSLYETVPEMNSLGRKMAEQSYVQALKRIHDLQTLNVKQRLDKFYIDHPELYGVIQIQHLCSYLGIDRNAYARYSRNTRD